MKIIFVAPHTSDKGSSQHVSDPADGKTDGEEPEAAVGSHAAMCYEGARRTIFINNQDSNSVHSASKGLY